MDRAFHFSPWFDRGEERRREEVDGRRRRRRGKGEGSEMR